VGDLDFFDELGVSSLKHSVLRCFFAAKAAKVSWDSSFEIE